jgi:uncharacterized membrane protein
MVVGRMIAWGGQPLGAAAGGLLAQAAGVRSAYLLAAGLFAIAALVATTVRVPDAGGLSAVVAPDTVTG